MATALVSWPTVRVLLGTKYRDTKLEHKVSTTHCTQSTFDHHGNSKCACLSLFSLLSRTKSSKGLRVEEKRSSMCHFHTYLALAILTHYGTFPKRFSKVNLILSSWCLKTNQVQCFHLTRPKLLFGPKNVPLPTGDPTDLLWSKKCYVTDLFCIFCIYDLE